MNIAGLLQSIAGLAWLGVIGVFVLIIVRVSRRQPTRGLSYRRRGAGTGR